MVIGLTLDWETSSAWKTKLMIGTQLYIYIKIDKNEEIKIK